MDDIDFGALAKKPLTRPDINFAPSAPMVSNIQPGTFQTPLGALTGNGTVAPQTTNPILASIARAANGDPRVEGTMKNIYASESRHKNEWDIGDHGFSGGPFQLDTQKPGMVGSEFQASHPGMNVSDPKTLDAQADYVADWIRNHPNQDYSKVWHGLQHPDRFGNLTGGYAGQARPDIGFGGKPDINFGAPQKGGGFGEYIGTSLSQLGKIPGDIARGAVETAKEIGQGYMQGQAGARTWAAKPLYGIGGALKAAASSPAAQALGEAGMGLAGVELPPALPGGAAVRAAENIPTIEKAAPDVAKAVKAEVAPEAKLAGAALTPQSAGAAASFKYPTATIKPGKGVWGASTEGRNVIRQQIGEASRRTAQEDAALEQFRKASNQMTPEQSVDAIRYMQSRTAHIGPSGEMQGPASKIDPAFQGMADEIRHGYSERRAEMENIDSMAKMQFEEDHFAQRWEDPRAAQKVFRDYGAGKEGSSQFTKAKKFTDWDAGLAAGLKPKTFNIVDIAANDFANQDRFIAGAKIRDIMEDQGFLKWSQSPKEIPDEWIPLKGWGAQKGMGWQAYAPPGMARNYNNFYGKGWAAVSPTAGSIANGLRSTTAGFTAAELGFSGYHALAISKEAIHTSFADAVYELAHGHPLSAAKELGKAPIAMPYYLAKGMRANKEYLGVNQGSATLTKAVDALSQVNAQMHKLDPAFLSGTGSNIFKTISRGAFQKELDNSLRHIADAPTILGKLGTSAKEVGGALGDVLNTAGMPLFQWIIPNVKRGMMADAVSKFIDANPLATWDQILDHAQTVSDVADERFGEMVQDNLFWQPLVKQSAQIAMRSASWAYGSWTQYIGGVKELKDIPKSGLSRRSAYVLAGLIVEPMIAGMLTYWMTGKMPTEYKDFVFPKTGGTVPEHPYGKPEEKYTVPERLQLPGNIKEILDIAGAGDDAIHGDISGFRNYAAGKLNDFWQAMGDLSTNTQWPNDPLYNPALPESAIQQYFKWAWNRFGPISVKSGTADIPQGTKLGPWVRATGPRVPGRRWIDPEGYEYARMKMNKQKAKITEHRAKKRHEDASPEEAIIEPRH